MKNIRAIIRKSGSVALAAAMVLSSSGVMTYAATSDVQNTISAIEQSYGIDSAKYAQDITDTAAANANTIPTTTDIMANVTDTTGITTTKQNEQTEIDAETEYTTPELSADVYEETDEPQADTVSSGKWGTCDWNINDGVLTISGGVASGSVKGDRYWFSPWDSYKYSIKKVVIEDTITFENNASLAYLFAWHHGLKEIDGLDKFDTSNVTDMSYMFDGCESLTTIDVSNFDTLHVEYMGYMFDGCNSLIKLDLSNFNLKNATLGTGGKPAQYGFLPTEGKSLKQIIMPSALGKERNIKIVLDEMYTIASSWTDKTANKVYAEKPDTLIAGHTYVVTGSEYDKTELSINATKKENGNKITFTANANGGDGKYTYKFLVYNKTTNSWAKLQDFSDKNTFTWTKGNAGDRYFYVDVKDSTGKTVRSAALNVNTAGTVSKPTSTLTASTEKVNVGGKVTLTAKAGAGSGKYTYKFLIYNPSTNQWAKLQDFSANSTFTWTAGSAGNRQFYVDVKDSNGNVTRSKVVNVAVDKAQSVNKLTVKATASTTANKVGENVTFTAAANGGTGKYTYKFLVYNKTTNQWAKLQDFGVASKLTWTAGSAAERQFFVDVKDSNGTVVRSSVMNVKTTK